MADQKISGLPADTSLDANHYFLLNDPVGPVTKRTTLATLLSYLQSLTGIIKKSMIDYTSVDVYSTTEFDTGKKWVDGRPIYRKVFRGTMNVIAGTINVAHGISATTSWEVVSFVGGVKIASTTVVGSQVALMHREAGGNWVWLVDADITNLVYQSSFAWGTSWYTVVMEYVK